MLLTISAPPQVIAERPKSEFEQMAIVLVRFHALGVIKGDYESGVTFDAEMARRYGFSERVIKLGEQVAAATNDLIVQARAMQEVGKQAQVTEFAIDAERYPELQRFWAEAARFTQVNVSITDQSDIFVEEVKPLGVPGISHIVCGYYSNPKPSTNGPWTTHRNISNPEATLRSWGYHPTPGLVGGGWTRPQTYQPLFCGWNTFRDHAYISAPWTIREQNYTGEPGGEPNPEIYLSGPWPYPDWPLYVIWWHRWGPGR